MEYASGLIKLKPGSEEKVEEWRNTIASRLDEAAATLKTKMCKSNRGLPLKSVANNIYFGICAPNRSSACLRFPKN